MEKTRTIILHYHLFKNAGTSIDKILKANFKEKWLTKEFEGVKDNTEETIRWINENPEAIAFSSHTMNGSMPTIEGVNIISIMMFRNPVKRIISAYKFERTQKADTWGAMLAKTLSFEEYVIARLQKSNDTQCRNFQTSRLATHIIQNNIQKNSVVKALQQLSIVGLVEEFEESVHRMKEVISQSFPDFDYEINHSNKSRLFDFELSPTLNQLLIECNHEDLKLFEHIKDHYFNNNVSPLNQIRQE